MGLPETGLAAVFDLARWTPNVGQYMRDIERAEAAERSAAGNTQKMFGEMSRSASRASSVTAKMHGAMSNAMHESGKASGFAANMASSFEGAMRKAYNAVYPLPGALGRMARAMARGGMSMGSFSKQLASLSTKALAVTAAVAGLVVAMGALVYFGRRGATFKGIADGFGLAAQKAGVLSSVLLGELRQAARGTVSDIELMRKANMAFAGTSGALAKAFGDGGLAGLMKVARAQARVTGRDVNYLFESLVLGVKRLQPRLIDNTDLQIRTQKAYEELAQSLGKSVDALTTEERQVAILNATLKAGKDAVDRFSDSQLTAKERSQQLSAAWTNMLDRLALAAQPAYELLLAFGQMIMDVVTPAVSAFATILYEIGDATFGVMLHALERFTNWIKSAFSPLAKVMHKWLVLIVGAIRGMGTGFQILNDEASKWLTPVADKIALIGRVAAYVLDPNVFAYHAGLAFAAMGVGIMKAANKYIFPAVIAIAKFISNFLMGHSPPPMGPLSTIDKGGEATMRAWLSGFVGVSLDPVQEVAGRVNDALGAIGRMTGDQVAARLKEIEDYLQPYRDWLDIVKARLESVNGLLDAFAQRTKLALKHFMSGEMSVDQMRALDRQTENARELATAYEEAANSAEIQLKLAESQFAVEKVLLSIQQRRTASTEDEEDAAKNAAKAARGAAGKASTASGGESSLLGLSGGGLEALLGVNDDEVRKGWAGVVSSFSRGLTGFGEGEFGREAVKFQLNMDRLRSAMGSGDEESGWGRRLGGIFTSAIDPLEKFSSVFKVAFSTDLPESINNFALLVAEKLATDGTITTIFNNFSLGAFTVKFATSMGKNGDVPNILNSFGETITTFFKWEKGGKLHDAITKAAQSVKNTLGNAFRQAASAMVLALWQGLKAIADLWNNFVGDLAKAAGSVPGAGGFLEDQLNSLRINIGEAPTLFTAESGNAAGFGGGAPGGVYVPPVFNGQSLSIAQAPSPVVVNQTFTGVTSSADVFSAVKEATMCTMP